MICYSCGAAMPDYYKFCIKCGSKVVQAAPAPVTSQAKHFSLEDIARQQSEKNETRLVQSAPAAPTPAPQPPAAPKAKAVTSPVAGPAVPFGEQAQVSFSIFAPDAAEILADLTKK